MNVRRNLAKGFNKRFTLLDQNGDRYLLILICLIFSIVFLNVFVPFNINRWYSDSGFIQFLRLSGYGIVVAVALLFTQFPLRKIFRIPHFTLKTFLLWLFIELILISLTYIFLFGNPLGNFFNELIFSLKYTLLGICLPYSLALLLIHYKNQYLEIQSLKEKIKHPDTSAFVHFRDENGKTIFSLLMKDLLFLESAGNYVFIHYLAEGKKKRTILRNTLKKLEDSLPASSVVRCHRSFMVNAQNIQMAKKDGKKRFLQLKQVDRPIPVSPKYFPLFLPFIS